MCHMTTFRSTDRVRWWSHKIIKQYYNILKYNIIVLTIVLQLLTVISTTTCCTGLLPRSNWLYHITYVCSRLNYYLGLCKYMFAQ